MKIGILSDTHMPRYAKQLPKAVREGLEGVELIIHAGDWQSMWVYDELSLIAPVEGVAGNTDGWDIYERFGERKLLRLAEYKIGVVHGHGIGKTTEIRAYEAFQDESVDAIIFGHSHVPLNIRHEGVLLFNPGSPTDKRRQPLYSFGKMTLGEELTAEHVFFEDKS
ncbi:metallophosphoesterase family protein [Paenibacillus sp. J2TS4]|uniref:metallophosphoesterase family protein n=1 Tax=Paenibacillus sp. J2TS4 TaxID=2807194 RepID=UPI001B092EEB|nr:metallophosphoesterase [Paenibacillus sp. J2TS4]GIP33157.1 phosphoesterase [Paenibacillus sp. J2TS4]